MIATTETGRLFFGPYEIGRIVEGIHVFGFSDGATDTHVELEVAAFVTQPVDDADGFADGENLLQTTNLMVPLDVSAFLPLDALADRLAYVGVQFTNPGAGTVNMSVGVESRTLTNLPIQVHI